MRDPALKARLLAEEPTNPDNPMYLLLRGFENIYRMEREPDYEPAPQKSVAAMAKARGISPAEMAYELLLEDEGLALLRSEEHTSELQSLMRISYAVF